MLQRVLKWFRKAEPVKDNQTIYSECYKDPKYAMGEQRFDRVRAAIDEAIVHLRSEGISNPRLLDVGCGRAEILQWAAKRGGFSLIYGEEIVPDLCGEFDGYHVEQIDSISESKFGGDIVVCSDVLEHIQPMETDAALVRLWNSAAYALIIHVAWFPTERVMQDGTVEQLHINRMDAMQWVGRLAMVTGKKTECWEFEDQTALLVVYDFDD